MSVTLNSIAHRAGCSTATVSRALNATARVSGATHARIMAAAAALGDRQALGQDAPAAPQRHPGRPRGALSKPDTVEIVCYRRDAFEPVTPSSDGLQVAPVTDLPPPDQFFAPRYRLAIDLYLHIIEGALTVCAANGLKAVQQMRRDLNDDAWLDELRTTRRRGLLLLGESDPSIARVVEACRFPVVLVDILGVAAKQIVAVDNAGGMAAVIQHLVALGHRDIAFVGNAANLSYRERRACYYGQMLDAGLSVRPTWIYDGPTHVEDVARGMRALLARRQRPSAVVCCNDWAAMGVIRAATELGLRVPDDLSVTGFDDVDAAALVKPALTTVHAPVTQLGAVAARLLLEQNDDAPHFNGGCATRLHAHLVIRQTTTVPSAPQRSTKKGRK
jgi:LacI family transcriptional regulator